jgi:hypothetical protein
MKIGYYNYNFKVKELHYIPEEQLISVGHCDVETRSQTTALQNVKHQH